MLTFCACSFRMMFRIGAVIYAAVFRSASDW